MTYRMSKTNYYNSFIWMFWNLLYPTSLKHLVQLPHRYRSRVLFLWVYIFYILRFVFYNSSHIHRGAIFIRFLVYTYLSFKHKCHTMLSLPCVFFVVVLQANSSLQRLSNTKSKTRKPQKIFVVRLSFSHIPKVTQGS